MAFRYNKLWHLLLDKGMTKENLRKEIGSSSSTLAKLSKGDIVSLEVIDKICEVLNCGIEDIMERVPDNAPK